MYDIYTHTYMTCTGKTAFSFTALFANLKAIFFSQNKTNKTQKRRKKEEKKVIIKILTFKRSISLMQSCLALASIISKIFKHKTIEDKNETTTKKYFIL